MASVTFNPPAHSCFRPLYISNIALSLGIASLFAERVIQTCEDSDRKTMFSWASKAVQMGAFSFTFFSGFPEVTAMMLVANYSYYRHILSTEGKISRWVNFNILFTHQYKIALSLVTGYWVDRSLQLTPKKGPVMAVVSLALLALSTMNIRYDVNNLPRQMRALLKIQEGTQETNTKLVETRVECFVLGLVVIAQFLRGYQSKA